MMTAFSKKLTICACGCALLSFSAGIISPMTADAAFGLKLPKIILSGPGNTDEASTIRPTPQSTGNICGQAFFNNTNNGLPAAGFEVYLLRGDPGPGDVFAVEGDTLVIYSPAVKLGVTDEQGRYSAPVPPNINDFASNHRFPEVRFLFYKPNTGFLITKHNMANLTDFRKIENISYGQVGSKTTHVVFR